MNRHKLFLILTGSFFIFSTGCITQNNLNRGTDSPVEIVLKIETTAIELAPLKIEESFPESKMNQIDSLEKYIVHHISKSPYYTVALTNQKRVVTQSLGKMENRFILTLSMYNYDTGELESSAVVDFLSLSEFDYAVDLAVLMMEGREIIPSKKIELPTLSFEGFQTEELNITTNIPEAHKNVNIETKQVEGMLRDFLKECDHQLMSGKYSEAKTLYMDFLERFDHGITDSLANEMGDLKSYAEKKLSQAEFLISLTNFEQELIKINSQATDGTIEKAFRTITGLSIRIQAEQKQYPDLLGSILDKVKNDQAALYSHLIEKKLLSVKNLINEEDFSSAYNNLREIRIEIEEKGMSRQLPDLLANIRQSEMELERTCKGLEEAKTREFLYNISYYGFNTDKTALEEVFREYRTFLMDNPFTYNSAILFNHQLEYYKKQFNIKYVSKISAPADNYAQLNYKFNEGIEAYRFPEAEKQIRMLYLFGSSFTKYLTEKGENPVELSKLLERELNLPTPSQEYEKKTFFSRFNNLDSFEEIVQRNPNVIYHNKRLSELNNLYKNFQEEKMISDPSRYEPKFLEMIIDQRGLPVYVYVEEGYYRINSDKRNNDVFMSYLILSLVYHDGKEFRTVIVDHMELDDNNYVFFALEYVALTLDQNNNPVISYVKNRDFLTVKFTETERKEYPPIIFVNKSSIWSNGQTQRYFFLHQSIDGSNEPGLLFWSKKGLISFKYKNKKWADELLIDGGNYSKLTDNCNFAN